MGMFGRTFIDQQMMKSDFGAMEMGHSGTFSFVESLGGEPNMAVPTYNSNQSIMSSAQMAANAEVW